MFDPLVGVEVLVGPGPSLLFVGGLRVVVGSEEGGGLDILWLFKRPIHKLLSNKLTRAMVLSSSVLEAVD